MRIGIPTEIKPLEGRVGLIPAAAGDLVRAGHEVLIQSGAGLRSGYPDEAYEAVGVRVVPDAAATCTWRPTGHWRGGCGRSA